MLTPRFLALPAIALAVIAALAQAHGRSEAVATPTVVRAVNCATQTVAPDAACMVARNAGIEVR